MSLSINYVLGFIALLGITGSLLALPAKAHAAAVDPSKIIIVYFSHTNNTRTVAENIQSIVGGDLLELKTAQKYPSDHDETVRIAVAENKSNARPELATTFPDNMDDYDVFFVGYPVWEYTMPMALFTFFDRYTFAGKTIIPFSTHLGSRLAGGPRDIASLCPQAKILDGLAIRGPEAAKSRGEVERWLKKLGLAQ